MKKPGWSVYPNLEKWINENCESVSEFAWLVAVSEIKESALVLEYLGGLGKLVIYMVSKHGGFDNGKN